METANAADDNACSPMRARGERRRSTGDPPVFQEKEIENSYSWRQAAAETAARIGWGRGTRGVLKKIYLVCVQDLVVRAILNARPVSHHLKVRNNQTLFCFVQPY